MSTCGWRRARRSAETDRAIQAAQRVTEDIDTVDLSYSVAGTGNRLDANPVDAGENTGTLSVTLEAGAGRMQEDAAMNAMREELSALPGVQYEFSRPSLMSFSSPLQIEISGYDLIALEAVNQSVLSALSASDRFTDIKTTIESGNPEIQIVFDQERAAALGLSPYGTSPIASLPTCAANLPPVIRGVTRRLTC